MKFIFRILVFISLLLVVSSSWASFDINAYQIHLEPSLEKSELDVALKIQLTITKDIHTIKLPVGNLKIRHVPNLPVGFKWKVDSEFLLITSEAEIKKDSELSINVDYSGKPEGVVFSESAIYSNYSSCKWLLCQDEPGDRFLIELSIKAPQGWEALSNGSFQGEQNGFSVWKTDRAYPGYLVGFAVGEFSIDKRTLGSKEIEVYSQTLSSEELDSVFSTTVSALNFFKEKAGFDLPTDSYSQVFVPGHMAQEKSTFSILGMALLDPMFSDPTEDWFIVHEAAHQWWGNSIICNSWPHFWLNEGITTFMVAAYKGSQWGQALYDREVSLATKWYQRAIDNDFDVPLSFSGAYPSLKIKRSIVYSKGFLFLNALKNTMGEEQFWQGFKNYSKRFKNKNVVSQDFQHEMQKVSKIKLDKVFSEWVY